MARLLSLFREVQAQTHFYEERRFQGFAAENRDNKCHCVRPATKALKLGYWSAC